MATAHDQDTEGAGPKSDRSVDDLALPEAFAERVAGGDGITYKQLVPGNSGWTPVTLKRGLTSE